MRLHALKTKIVTPLHDETLAFYTSLPGLALVEQWDEPGDKGAILGFADGAEEAFLENLLRPRPRRLQRAQPAVPDRRRRCLPGGDRGRLFVRGPRRSPLGQSLSLSDRPERDPGHRLFRGKSARFSRWYFRRPQPGSHPKCWNCACHDFGKRLSRS